MDRYVALLVATVVRPDLPHRYHCGGWLLPGLLVSQSRTVWRKVRYASFPSLTSLTNARHVALTPWVASPMSTNTTFAACSVGTSRHLPLARRARHHRTLPQPSSTSEARSYRDQAVPAGKSPVVGHPRSKRRLVVCRQVRFKTLVRPKLPGNRRGPTEDPTT